MINIIEKAIQDFCQEFIKNPYLCYTEHGIHALFFNRLYNALPEKDRYFNWMGHKVCVIQKEYPTATDLEKSQRQHWDISVIDTPPVSLSKTNSYDFLRLNSVVEFGMNASSGHLKEDIRRMTRPDSNILNKYAVHLYRFSKNMSRRDISSKGSDIIKPDDVKRMVGDTDVKVYYAVADLMMSGESGVWVVG
ncbi:MAG: hypothetical protein KAS32_20470 [Candidatus Peribacteraceae bacterium]|nr:hypothetical protein [Candidatus Peribacteraceae bacterium]